MNSKTVMFWVIFAIGQVPALWFLLLMKSDTSGGLGGLAMFFAALFWIIPGWILSLAVFWLLGKIFNLETSSINLQSSIVLSGIIAIGEFVHLFSSPVGSANGVSNLGQLTIGVYWSVVITLIFLQIWRWSKKIKI